jgi:catechol 2,3-dioxygenase-like lactoylglutathione lyase family enzyme
VAEFRYVYYADAYDDSVAFYRDVLGAEQVDGWDGGRDNRGSIFAVGGGFIEVIAVPPPEWLGELGQPRDALRGRADAGWLLIEVDDVDAFQDRLRERGANIVESPRDLSWGHRDFGVREPGGLTLYFFSRV